MSRPTVYLAITNHGFGHAVRTSAVANEIQRRYPDVLLILVTTAPRWLLESYLDGDFIVRPRSFDVGVVQSDSLTMDKAATLEQWQQIRKQQREIIAGEVSFIKQNKVNLILADISPLATAIAEAAGIPCWMMGNFGWDFIYRDLGEEFMELADWISGCFSKCDRLFRFPLHEPMKAFPHQIDVGLTGGNPRFDLDYLRGKLGIKTPPEKTILLTFGGLGLTAIPDHNIERLSDYTFITFDQNLPPFPNLIQVSNTLKLPDSNSRLFHLRPVDLMPLCGQVISKPGYSTFAEAFRLDIPLVSLTRDGFAEAPVLLEWLQNYGTHQIITAREFFEQDWNFLDRQFIQPSLSQKLDKNGNEAIAQAVIDYVVD
ncbi:MAG TPA: glycosyl transferase [Planktothrix sp. UBA8407]|nr:glycosyl transferase [Planktothrix sp. UBA8407]